MALDSFTEVTSESFGGRIGQSCTGTIVGLVMFIVAFPVLYWNEGRAVRRHQSLQEGSSAVVSVSADAVTPGNEGKLVHMTGVADTQEDLADEKFGVTALALKLERTVEMYQWKEGSRTRSSKKLGGGRTKTTTYTYEKVWSDRLINSSSFKKPDGHVNPDAMPFKSSRWTAGKCALGSFSIPRSMVARINRPEGVGIPEGAPVPESIRDKTKRHGSGYYVGENPSSPQIGDMRIKFRATMPAEISVVAEQAGESLRPFATSNGETISLLELGSHSADAMFKDAEESNEQMTWILRAIGGGLMLFGTFLVLRPLAVITSFVPFMGTIVAAGGFLIALLLAGALSLITISVAWLAYRPVLGYSMLAGAVVLIVLMKVKASGAKEAGGRERGPIRGGEDPYR